MVLLALSGTLGSGRSIAVPGTNVAGAKVFASGALMDSGLGSTWGACWVASCGACWGACKFRTTGDDVPAAPEFEFASDACTTCSPAPTEPAGEAAPAEAAAGDT